MDVVYGVLGILAFATLVWLSVEYAKRVARIKTVSYKIAEIRAEIESVMDLWEQYAALRASTLHEDTKPVSQHEHENHPMT